MQDRSESKLFLERLRSWWRCRRALDRDEQYLAAATDPADLERRLRVLEHGSGGPQFGTFNH